MIRLLLPIVLLAATGAIAAPACDGQLVTMRVSKLKPGGTAAGFADAVKANADWYKTKGLTNDQFISASVMSYVGGKATPSADEFVTMHIVGGAKAPEHKRDARWSAFVAKYQANSTIASEMRMCLPKTAMLTVK